MDQDTRQTDQPSTVPSCPLRNVFGIGAIPQRVILPTMKALVVLALIGAGCGSPGGTCKPCVTSQDCAGAVCAQLAGDSYCVSTCPGGNECSADTSCVPVTDVGGQQLSACVPRSDVCGGPSVVDAGTSTGICGTLVGATTPASCQSCRGKPSCQANGCYGGWLCNTATSQCQSPPSACVNGATDGGVFDPGPPVTGQVGPTGGTISRLYFGVVGDTRPPNVDDTAGYPTAIINAIFADLQALPVAVPFVITTGDYMFASTRGQEAGPQLDLYLAARAQYAGTVFPAMGNHECTGATASNCGPASADGVTSNYATYLAKMLAPIAQTLPYYAVNLSASDGSWTAKLVFVAANAWSADQAAWLDTTLAQATTYTIVVRHESRSANTAPGVTPSEQIMARYPYTLSIVGHTHTYEHFSGREVIIGNGGAPISSGKNYGFGVVSQRTDGALQVDMLDYATGSTDTRFRFAVKADGTPAP